ALMRSRQKTRDLSWSPSCLRRSVNMLVDILGCGNRSTCARDFDGRRDHRSAVASVPRLGDRLRREVSGVISKSARCTWFFRIAERAFFVQVALDGSTLRDKARGFWSSGTYSLQSNN